jgi:hypothetical protein
MGGARHGMCELGFMDFTLMTVTSYVRTVIPNLGYMYPQGYELGHVGLRKKKLNNGGKRHMSTV